MNQEQIQVEMEMRQQIEKYCRRSIMPTIAEDDEKALFRKEIFQGLGELGLSGMAIDQKYGGQSMPYQLLSSALEEVARFSIPYAVTLSVSAMVQGLIQEFGSEVQKNLFLPELTSGREIGAFALSESGSGSDAASLTASAQKTSGGYFINGNKMWITSGGVAKTYVVMARTGKIDDGAKGITAFLVEHDRPGFTVGKLENKMGWRVSPTSELIFQKCFIPDSHLLGKEGQGLKMALSALDRGRVSIAAIAVGAAEEALNEATRYTLLRKQFGQFIFDFQGMQFLIADLATQIRAAKLLVQDAVIAIDQNEKVTTKAAMAKLWATDTAMKVAVEAVQMMGGVGLTKEYPFERNLRDTKFLQIVEGTNQIQRIVIAKQLAKKLTK